MNRLNVLATILCLTLFFNSCQKDNILNNTQLENQLQNTDDIEVRNYDEEVCGQISDLCLRCQFVFEEHIPSGVRLPDLSERQSQSMKGVDNNYVEIIIDGETYTIRPAAYFGEQTQEYLISTPQGNYITSNIQNDYVRSKALEDVELPSILQNIYEFDHKRFIDGNLNFLDVRRAFGLNTQLLSRDEEGLTISTGSVGLGGGCCIVLYDPCYGVNMPALVMDYQEVLGMNDPHTNAEQIIEDALTTNTPAGFNPKTDCLNTQDVVVSILNDPLISNDAFADFSIKLNYLTTLLGLDEDTYNSLILFNSQNIALVDEIYNGLTVSQNLGACDEEDCGLAGGYHELIRTTLEGVVLSSTDLESLLDSYSLLRCERPSLYQCFRRFQQDSESQTLAGCFSNGFNNDFIMEVDDNGNVVNTYSRDMPFSCESFTLTQIGTYTYRTTVLNWQPGFITVGILPSRADIANLGPYSFDIEVTGVPNEEECEIQNLVSEAFNAAVLRAMEFFGPSLIIGMPPEAEETLRQVMEFELQTQLAVKFPFGAFVNIPAIDESVGQPLKTNNLDTVVDCCAP